MPLYEYVCQKCKHETEVIQRVGGRRIKICPRCGGNLKRAFSAPAIQFKGSGFYITDYTKGGKEGKSEASASSKTESSEKPADKPADKPAEKAAEKAAEKPAEKTGRGDGETGGRGDRAVKKEPKEKKTAKE